TTGRVAGRSGVWLAAEPADPVRRPERKVAALGIRVSRGVTTHGFALNCDVDLAWYDRFVPCGIADAGVTSLTRELGRAVRTEDVLGSVERHLGELLAWTAYAKTLNLPAPGNPATISAPRGIDLLTPAR
ncbi:MAG: lipoyl protein ligase domain-containing protein, partial [Nocardioides sp.]